MAAAIELRLRPSGPSSGVRLRARAEKSMMSTWPAKLARPGPYRARCREATVSTGPFALPAGTVSFLSVDLGGPGLLGGGR